MDGYHVGLRADPKNQQWHVVKATKDL